MGNIFGLAGGALVQKVALSALVVGAMTSVSLGTFASFTAQTTSAGNVFAAGTLVLSSTRQGGAACLSTAGGTTDTNANGACDALVNLTVRKPGDAGTANLTLKNEGSLAASALKAFSTACTNADAPGESYHGTGNPCGKLQLYLQEYSDAGFATASACRYGGSSDGGTTCDFSDATKTLAAFATAYGSSSSGLALAGGLPAGGSRYLKIGVKLPSDADNSYQGRKASAELAWYIEQ
jgi:predicted ribosomally synthesized peptide with SipW-like signal peptide